MHPLRWCRNSEYLDMVGRRRIFVSKGPVNVWGKEIRASTHAKRVAISLLLGA